jgi:hypothetical protein
MNLRPGGKQARLRDGWFMCGDQKITQQMNFPSDHPEYPDMLVSLHSNVVDGAVVALGAVVFESVITAFTAAIFASKLNAFSRLFFFWVCLPCPGPGIAE